MTIKFMNKIKIEYEFYGITRDPETKNYMMVLNNKCKKCNALCNSIHFQQNFENWASDNDDIDKFIQDTELSEHTYNLEEHALEQMPYDRLNDISKNKFSKVYKANWIDGEIYKLNNTNQNWMRCESGDVILKSLCNSKNITIKFTNEINIPFEITQDPETKDYIMNLQTRLK
ncbi:kinase-like domain-containing protein [Rhizophagus irregularis DAOM 181602=DAOM 197198]|nr:kinase-like domain-containing protein [Rhizophagus irregularis DAOM 181602=DAOM 197198]